MTIDRDAIHQAAQAYAKKRSEERSDYVRTLLTTWLAGSMSGRHSSTIPTTITVHPAHCLMAQQLLKDHPQHTLRVDFYAVGIEYLSLCPTDQLPQQYGR